MKKIRAWVSVSTWEISVKDLMEWVEMELKPKAVLLEQGLIDTPQTEIEETTVSLPVEGMTAEGLKNLIFLTHSKQYLINRAFAEEVFRIPAELTEALGSAEIPDAETFRKR